jgi:hypothetical protein
MQHCFSAKSSKKKKKKEKIGALLGQVYHISIPSRSR